MNNDLQYFNNQSNNQNINIQPQNNFNTNNQKNYIKYIIIALVVLIIAISGFFIIKGLKSNKKVEQDLGYIFDANKPIKIQKDNKYGFITSEGEVMIEPQYKSANDFYGDYALVEIDNPDSDSFLKSTYQVIDQKGEVKITSDYYSGISFISDYNLWLVDGKLYDGKFKQITGEEMSVSYLEYGYFKYTNYVKEESGIMNHNLKPVFSWAGTTLDAKISSNDYTDNDYYALVESYEERAAIVSLKSGEIIYNLEDVENERIRVESNNIFSIYNTDDYESYKFLYFRDGKLTYEISDIYDLNLNDYENKILEINYGYDYKELGKSQREYYYDLKDNKLLDKEPTSNSNKTSESSLKETMYGYRDYSCSSKDGLIAGENIVIPCEYDDISFLGINLFNYIKQEKKQELILLEKGKETVLMNLKNKETVATFPTSYIDHNANSTFIKYSVYGDSYQVDSYVVYNLLTGQTMSFDKDSSIQTYSNYFIVTKNKQKLYYNTNFKQIYTQDV